MPLPDEKWLESQGSIWSDREGVCSPHMSLQDARAWCQVGAFRAAGLDAILQEKSFNVTLSGNEVYCTYALLLLIKIMLCRILVNFIATTSLN